jgi:hypothetical protein
LWLVDHGIDLDRVAIRLGQIVGNLVGAVVGMVLSLGLWLCLGFGLLYGVIIAGQFLYVALRRKP